MVIGNNNLKNMEMKVYAGRKSKALKYDIAAYLKGWVDGQKVDRKTEDRRRERKLERKRNKFVFHFCLLSSIELYI